MPSPSPVFADVLKFRDIVIKGGAGSVHIYPTNSGKRGSAHFTWSLNYELLQSLCCLSEVNYKGGGESIPAGQSVCQT